MRKSINFLFFLLLFFSSWTNAFALTTWLTLANTSIIIFIFFSLIITIIKKKFLFHFNHEDFILIIVFVLQLFLTVFNINSDSLSYILASFYTFFFLYMLLKSLIISNIKISDFLKFNFYAVVLISCFGSIEFILRILFETDIQIYINRTMKATAQFSLIDSIVLRTYAFSEEPTYLAWYLNTLGLLAVYYAYNVKKNLIYLIPILITYITTFSAAGFVLIIVSVFSYYVLKLKINNLLKFSSIFIFVSLILSFFFGFENLLILLEPIYNKISLSQDRSGDRFPEWTEAFNLFLESPLIGKGLGYYSSNSLFSPMNYFLFVLVESGIFVLFFLLIFYLVKLSKIFYSNLPYRNILFVAVLSGILHLLTQSLFYHPCLWLLLIFVDYSLLDYKKSKINTFK